MYSPFLLLAQLIYALRNKLNPFYKYCVICLSFEFAGHQNKSVGIL